MTLLELIQQVADELALDQPTVIIGSTDKQVRQLYALLSRLGNDLCRQFDWQRLNKEHILQTVSTTLAGTTVAGSAVITGISSTSTLSNQFGIEGIGIEPFAQILTVDNATTVTMTMPATESGTVDLDFSQVQYDLPDDWLKEIPQTEWDRTNRWPLIGPQSPQDWQSYKSGIVYAGPRERFRILANAFTLNPPPPDGLIFAYEYISKSWIESNGERYATFQTDDDTMIFSDSLLITGLKAQWKAAKGLDGTFDLGEFRNLLEQNKAQDKSAPKLSLSPYCGTVLMSTANVPDGNWPSG